MKQSCYALLVLFLAVSAYGQCPLSIKADEALRPEVEKLMKKKGYIILKTNAPGKLTIHSQAEYERSCEAELEAWVFTSVDLKQKGKGDIHFEDVFSFPNNSMNEKKTLKRKKENLKKLMSFLPDCKD